MLGLRQKKYFKIQNNEVKCTPFILFDLNTMHRGLELRKHRRGPHLMSDPILMYDESEWRKLNAAKPRPADNKESVAEKERARMALQSQELKTSWINTAEVGRTRNSVYANTSE